MVVCFGRKTNASRAFRGELFGNYDTPTGGHFARVRLWVIAGFAILKEPSTTCWQTDFPVPIVRGSGEIGRHTILRGWRPKGMGVQVPPSAPSFTHELAAYRGKNFENGRSSQWRLIATRSES